MVTNLENLSKESSTEYSIRWSDFDVEIIDGERTLIYCPYCLDPDKKPDIKLEKRNRNCTQILDRTCEECSDELDTNESKCKSDEEKKEIRKWVRDSHRNLMKVFGHDREMRRRLSYKSEAKLDS